MKRFLFLAVALTIAATSCTESGIIDTPDFYGKSIVFDSYIGKNPVTKAEDVDINYLKEGVDNGANILAFTSPLTNTDADKVDYSSTYLEGTLKWNKTNTAWEYYNADDKLEEPYMPTGKDLAFAAYNLKADQCIPSKTQTQFEFAIKDEVASQVDLLVTPLTFIEENENGETTVPLRFYHLLTKVGFKVQSTGGEGTAIYINSIKLCGKFPKTGRVDLTLASATPSVENGIDLTGKAPVILANTGNDASYATEYELIKGQTPFQIYSEECATPARVRDPQAAEGNCFMMIMPGAQTSASIVVSYRLGDSGEYNVSTIDLADLERLQFEAGKAYEFIFTIATTAIDFSAEVVTGDWNSPTNINE